MKPGNHRASGFEAPDEKFDFSFRALQIKDKNEIPVERCAPQSPLDCVFAFYPGFGGKILRKFLYSTSLVHLRAVIRTQKINIDNNKRRSKHVFEFCPWRIRVRQS